MLKLEPLKGFDLHKYQGTGNDFILLDRREGHDKLPSHDDIRSLCDRHFGVGGDGLILLLPDEGVDMEMRFFNPDASMSFCGNGSRCAVKAFFELGQGNGHGKEGELHFRAIDGIHRGRLDAEGRVEVSIGAVGKIHEEEDHYFLDTGSPHVILPREGIERIDLEAEADRYRKRAAYRQEGSNVNLVEPLGEGRIRMRTYERGVEDETLSCGSGVTAAALWAAHIGLVEERCMVSTRGGELEVLFQRAGEGFREIHLLGPAERVFWGRTL